MSTTAQDNNTHWADRMPAGFYQQAADIVEPFGVGLNVVKGLDVAVRTVLASLISAVSVPAGYSGSRVAADIAALIQQGQCDHPLAPFSQPIEQATFTVEPVKPPLMVNRGIFERVTWQSVYTGNDAYQPSATNQSAVAYLWRHGDRPRPTVVVLHGFIASWWAPNEYFMGLSDLYDQGCDVVLKTLPHHGDRNHSRLSLSGLGYVSGGIQHLNHAVVQSTYDIRSLIDFLLGQLNAPRVGITGLSLGGYTTALIAGLEPRLSFALPIVPIVSIPDAMMEWKPLDRLLNGIMEQFGLSMAELRKTVAFHSPLAMPAQLDREKLMIVAGYGDRMASPRHTEALQNHWQGCDVHWFKGSHVVQLGRRDILDARKAFLRRVGFI
ncbi:MAG: hypothetical protein GY938_27475 [Ketobacter sp.]|nr:hypothetical protein [Ketobacter sp.]